MIVLQRDTVMVVSVPFTDEYAADDPRLTALDSDEAVRMEVEVVLEDGSTLQGMLAYVMPDGQRRLQDFLNQPERFLILRDGDRARLIHKRRIIRIYPV